MKRKKQNAKGNLAAAALAVALIAVVIALASVSRPERPGESGKRPADGKVATSTEQVPVAETATSTGYPYIAIVDGCGPYHNGACVNMRSGPGIEHPSILKLRTGVVLKVGETVVNESGETWYKIDPGRGIRHPDRITSDWYVSAEAAELIYNDGDMGLEADEEASTTKRILVSVPKQRLYAYDGGTLFLEHSVSTGHDLTPTQRGVFHVYWKTPSRYMQGPIEGVSDDIYDLPGVPWNLYFTYDGAVIHGAYWHNNFGRQWSHGCVNLPPDIAKKLYEWADLGTQVIITE